MSKNDTRIKLTAKQKKFCLEYLVDLNATQAAIRAGYSKKRAKEIGYENRTKPHLEAYIQELQKRTQERTEVTIDNVIQELASIAFSDIADIFDEDGNLKSLKDIEAKARKAISQIKVNENYDKDGNFQGYTKEIKTYDKLQALEKLMKHLGGYQKDNEQKPAIVQQITGMRIT